MIRTLLTLAAGIGIGAGGILAAQHTGGELTTDN